MTQAFGSHMRSTRGSTRVCVALVPGMCDDVQTHVVGCVSHDRTGIS